MRIFILIIFMAWGASHLSAQNTYDSILKSNILPITGAESFFKYGPEKKYTLYYKNGKLVKITGKLAAQSTRKATLTYIQDDIYTLQDYYNQSHSRTVDTICFKENEFMISNSQYSFSANDTIGRFIVVCQLKNNEMEGKIYSIESNFSFIRYCQTTNNPIEHSRLLYHFIIYPKGEYLNKKVLKKLHEFNASTSNITEYNLGKKAFNFYNIPLLIVW